MLPTAQNSNTYDLSRKRHGCGNGRSGRFHFLAIYIDLVAMICEIIRLENYAT